MIRQKIGNSIVELKVGDIANQTEMEAVVNAANAELRIGGGVAGALHKAAGPGLEEECRPLAPIQPGEAVITGAHNLPNKYVVHCLGPVYGRDQPEHKILANCYKNALQRAEEKEINSIAFPAISTGAFGYPLEEAAQTAIDTVLEEIPKLKSVQHIAFVLFTERELEPHKKCLNQKIKS